MLLPLLHPLKKWSLRQSRGGSEGRGVLRIFLLLWSLILLSVVSRSEAITIADGQVHIIDELNSYPVEDVYVRDGPGSIPTTILLRPGGEIGTFGNFGLELFEHSIARISGGRWNNLGVFWDNSTAVITGGSPGRMVSRGSSLVIIASGAHAFVGVAESANGGIYGGENERYFLEGATISVLGGGTFSGIGGYPVETRGTARLTIVGGAFSLIVVGEASRVKVYGTGFNRPMGPIAPLQGTITGTLPDGTAASFTFARASSAAIEIGCGAVGPLARSTAALAAGQDNSCEQWADSAFSGADLSGANLTFTDLRSVDFSDASLSRATLTHADLSGADLSGADLRRAFLALARYDETTTFPSGSDFKGPNWGLPLGDSPWEARMVPLPEPSLELLLGVGSLGLIPLSLLGRRQIR